MKNIFLIPSYEPDYKLINLLKKLSEVSENIIVVNDGSGKKYDKIFKESEKYAHVISYSTNKGKGHALKTGFKYIKDNYEKDYCVVTMDSDGQHSVSDAIKLLDLASKNDNTLILGKRLRSKNTPLRSRFGNEITMLVFYLSAGYSIYDTQTGLRSFNYKIMDYMLNITGERFEYEMNVLLNLKRNNINVLEEEIETIYIDNNSGTHFSTIKDSWRIYKDIIKFSFVSITSFLLDYILYVIFLVLSSSVIISNIFARIISATYNYNLNRTLVFENDNSIQKTFIQYFLLAFVVLILNTLLLNILVDFIGINEFVSKIITEITLFISNYFIQKKIIFRKEN